MPVNTSNMDILLIPTTLLVLIYVAAVYGSEEIPSDVPMESTCETVRCPPNATCKQFPTYVSCLCPYGKTGMQCDIDDPCLPRTTNCTMGALCFGMCNPNVVCNGATGIPQCAGCVAGWTGMNCMTDINECVDFPDICINGGTCVNLEGDYKCNCAPGWTGKDCFCKKGTSCDVADVLNKDQYSSGSHDDTDTTNQDPSNNETGDKRNSAENTRLYTSTLITIFVLTSFLS